jgi:hypothetical protein
MDTLIVKGTLISGRPVYPGDVEVTDDNTHRLLEENGKAVELGKATPDQLKLIEERKNKIAEAAKKGAK